MPRLLAPSISSTSTSSPAADALADVALVAGRRRRALHAVERLGQDAGGRRLADAAGAGEQVGVADAIAGDGVLQRPGDVLLADELVERLRPIAASDDGVAAGGLASSASGSAKAVSLIGLNDSCQLISC